VTPEEAERLLVRSRDADVLEHPPDQADLEDAVRWFAENDDGESACELAANVWRIWFQSGDVAGGRRLMAAALGAGGEPSRARALALYADGLLAFREGEQDESKTRNEAALETAQQARDEEAQSLAFVGLSRVALRDGDFGRVRLLAAEARELAPSAAAEAMPLHLLAAGTRLSGDLDDAVELYTESLELNRGLGASLMVGMELHNLGHVELRRGNVDSAKRHFADCRELRSPDNPYDLAMTDLNDAALAVDGGDRVEASRLLGRAEETLARAGIVLDPDDQSEVDWLRDRL
jgi:tetratricopeptide (TPR) repeat protein